MGKHYTEQEKRHIQELAAQGHTDEAIAQQLGRSTNAIRNYRHRTNIKTRETKNIEQIKQEKQILTKQSQELERRIQGYGLKTSQLKKAIQTHEQILKSKIQTELIHLKDKQPQLFEITGQEQLNKLTVGLTSSIIRWLLN